MEYKKPDVGEKSEICMPVENDKFDGARLGLQWQWQAHGNEAFYELDNRRLRLFALPFESETNILADAPNVLCQMVHSPNIEVITRINPKLNSGDCCGMVITGGNYYGFKLENVANELYLKVVSYEYDSASDINAPEEVIANMKIKIEMSSICMKIRMEYPGRIIFFYSYDGGDNFAQLGSVCNYKVSRKSWVGARVGIYCVNTKQENTGGYADFKYIKIE